MPLVSIKCLPDASSSRTNIKSVLDVVVSAPAIFSVVPPSTVTVNTDGPCCDPTSVHAEAVEIVPEPIPSFSIEWPELDAYDTSNFV